jgi:poly(A) polymerase
VPTTPRPADDAIPAAPASRGPSSEPAVGTSSVETGSIEGGDHAALSEAQRRAVAELLRVSPVADDLAARFAAAGHALALVGGSVRDALLGRLGQDLDFTTDARPDQVLALVAPWADAHWETGIAFGTVAARKAGYTVEVTTYRDEAYERDSRKPAVTFGDTLEGDLVRRDFTVNAMAVALPQREFVDPHGGLRDLAARVLRTPGTPEESFSDDPLRMLRAARFAAQLGFDVAADVVAAMTAMADRISIVSAERVRDELVKLLLSADPVRGLRLIVDTGLAEHVLPELPKLKLEIDEHHRHKDVYEHTLTVLEQAIALEPNLPEGGPDLTLRLAALLHDVGKPRTRRFQPGGGVSFHNHEVVGARISETRLRELRFPKDLVADVARLVELHLRFHGYGTGEWTDSAVRRYVRDAGDLLPRLHALTRSDCTTRNRRRAAALSAAYDHLEERIARLAEEEELASLRPALDGNQIMTLLGLRPGPVVGRAYKHLMELRMDRGPMTPEEAEAALRAWWAQQPEAAED